MKNPSRYIILVMLCALHTNSYAQCPGGASWLNTPVNGTLKDSARIQVLDTVQVSSTNPTFGSFNAGRPVYTTGILSWAGYSYESIMVIRGGGFGASTTFKLKEAVDSNIMHFIISDIRGDGTISDKEPQRITGFYNGVAVAATSRDPILGATFAGNIITGGTGTDATNQSSIRIFFNGPVDSVVVKSNGFNDFVKIELAARCDFILPVSKIDFNAQRLTAGIELKWKIKGEAEYVEIERSGDNNKWTLLSRQTNNSIQYLDTNPLPGTNYYRIKIIEPGLDPRYSKIIAVKFNDKNNPKTLIYPNPFKDVIKGNSDEKIISYRISNTTGNIIVSKKLPGINNFIEVLPPALASGWYYITLFFQNGEQQSYKLYKKL